jgi:hypothetical protein
VDKNFFGLHDATNLAYGNLNVGAVRLWDVGVTWKDLEKSPGVFDFTRMDTLVNAALAEGSAITYVFGRTPLFYASAYTAAPPLDKWEAYVRKVVTRYKGKISHYQIWNEANVRNFFTGTTADMARMTKVAALAVNQCDPAAIVVAPSGPVRDTYMRDWYTAYWNEIVDGYQPWRWTNAVGFSMYPDPDLGPEDMFSTSTKMRKIMTDCGMPASKQVFHASEINYDVETGGPVVLLPDADQAGYTMRTYLVGACAGFERVHWYRYDWGYTNGQPLGNTYWTDPVDHDIVTPAGQAFNTIKSWMSGSFGGYFVDANGTYQAKFGTSTIAWNPGGNISLSGFDGKTRTSYSGGTVTVVGNVTITPRPVLLS